MDMQTSSEMSGGKPPTLTATESGFPSDYWDSLLAADRLRAELELSVRLNNMMAFMLMLSVIAGVGICGLIWAVMA